MWMWIIGIGIAWFLVSFGLGCLFGRVIKFGESTADCHEGDDTNTNTF